MKTAVLVLIALSAALELHGELGRQRRLIYLFKPLTTALITLVALLPPRHSPASYAVLVGLGLLASLAGDILLMLPDDRFVPGLASFAAAQLLYSAAFALRARWGLHPEALVVVAALIALNAVSVVRRAASLRLPVLAYLVVILTMAYGAYACWRTLGGWRPLAAFVGACLFVASDQALALDRFVRPLRAAPLVIMVAYYAAQCLIALSV
jgi:uncharacterized membrane protein YhhN